MKKKRVPKWLKQQQIEIEKAIAKGWMPKKTYYGKISDKLVGHAILVGFTDSKPQAGIILHCDTDYNGVRVFFPNKSYENCEQAVERDQIFAIDSEPIKITAERSDTITACQVCFGLAYGSIWPR